MVARTGLRAGAALQIPPPYYSNAIGCANPQRLREIIVGRLLSCAWYVVLRPNRDILMRGRGTACFKFSGGLTSVQLAFATSLRLASLKLSENEKLSVDPIPYYVS